MSLLTCIGQASSELWSSWSFQQHERRSVNRVRVLETSDCSVMVEWKKDATKCDAQKTDSVDDDNDFETMNSLLTTTERIFTLVRQLEGTPFDISRMFRNKIIAELMGTIDYLPTLVQKPWHKEELFRYFVKTKTYRHNRIDNKTDVIGCLLKNGASLECIERLRNCWPFLDDNLQTNAKNLFQGRSSEQLAQYLGKVWNQADSASFPLLSMMENNRFSHETISILAQRHPQSIVDEVLLRAFKENFPSDVLRTMVALFRQNDGDEVDFGTPGSVFRAGDALARFVGHFETVTIAESWEWEPTALHDFLMGLRVNTVTKRLTMPFPSVKVLGRNRQPKKFFNDVRQTLLENKGIEYLKVALENAEGEDMAAWSIVVQDAWKESDNPISIDLTSTSTNCKLSLSMSRNDGVSLLVGGRDHELLIFCGTFDVRKLTVSIPSGAGQKIPKAWESIPKRFGGLRELVFKIDFRNANQDDATSLFNAVLQNCRFLEKLEIEWQRFDAVSIFRQLKNNQTLRSLSSRSHQCHEITGDQKAACLDMLSTNMTILECHPWGHAFWGDHKIQYFLMLNQCGRSKASQIKNSADLLNLLSKVPHIVEQRASDEEWDRYKQSVYKSQLQKDDFRRSITFSFLRDSIGTWSPFVING
ncbi:hypothetical protein IV203_026234 [Nitzschia inconspicua]|uniref:Uncharacterized protein n=1 Tax=Nitzschia inconspicua TaxID=303405 RepID=A0A9K3LJC3_9STRA|nr:hypothetical protein IV203_026234 [Nitzschia inconspicua]